MTASVEEIELSVEATAAFRDYGGYSNYRAIPSALDGLKPGARRVLWAMRQNGYTPARRSTVKAMSAVGDILKYHPHGDSGTYDSMVTMAHVPDEGGSVKMYQPLLLGQGGWGDWDHGAAAPRYTECKLNEAAMALLGIDQKIIGAPEIDENGVDMVLNYSGELLEPSVLPALWPAFVVNGTMAIGTGISTDACSHNLTEVMNLAAKMVDSPNPRWETIKSILTGPDMPCEADIYDNDRDGIHSYMTTGYGSFVMRARYHVEDYPVSARKKGHKIIVTGLPYRMTPTKVIEGISDMVDAELLPAVDVANYTSSEGIRVEIDIKEMDPDDIINRLLFHGSKSRMQTTFSVQAHAVNADGMIQAVGPVDGIRMWIDHRRGVIRRRSRFRMDKAQLRLEIVEGLLIAIPVAEKLIAIIRSSESRKDAEGALRASQWAFSERQATAILDMTLSRLTKLSTDEYLDEKAKLEGIIEECQKIISDPKYLDTVLKKEIRSVRDSYGSDRRCSIVEGSPYVDPPETPAVEEKVTNGYILRSGKNWVRWITRITANTNMLVNNSDYVEEILRLTDGNILDGISNLGWQYRVRVSDLVDNNKMINSQALFPLDAGENLVTLSAAAAYAKNPVGTSLVMMAESDEANPVIKVVDWDVWSSLGAKPKKGGNKNIFSLDEGYEVTKAFFLPPEDSDIGILTAYGKLLRIPGDGINPRGRAARGVPAIKMMAENDHVVWMGPLSNEDRLAYWTSDDQIGWFPAKSIPTAGRNSQGALVSKSNALLSGARVVSGDHNALKWFNSTMDEPQIVELTDDIKGTNLNDRKLTTVAEGMKRSSAVWTIEA